MQVLNNGNSSGLRVFGYDPAVEQYAKEPEPADFVVCTDVLEHVEPECIRDVLEHIASLALKAFWAYITTSPSNKMLPCGKNAHILQRDKDWWARELRVSFPGGHFVPGYSMNRIMFWWCKKEAYKKYRRTEQMEQRA